MFHYCHCIYDDIQCFLLFVGNSLLIFNITVFSTWSIFFVCGSVCKGDQVTVQYNNKSNALKALQQA